MLTEVTYQQILALRADTNSMLFYTDSGTEGYILRTEVGQMLVTCSISKTGDDAEHFDTYVKSFCNKPISAQEVRFKTHDWSKVSDWDGRTHGDQVAYLAGGVLKHPVDGSWLDSTGASMIAAYATPGDPNYGNPAYLFGAWGYRLTAKYDDVNYKWTSADGSTRYAWLDLSVSPPVWKNDGGSTVVHYDSGTSQWIRNDNSSVVTSSLWRILPYELTKLQINKVKTTVDSTALFSGKLHYQIYMDLLANQAGPGYPAGNYKVADWNYETLAELAAGSDASPFIEPTTRPGHNGPVMVLTYDYINATKAPIIDSSTNMHLDILLSTNSPVTDTASAHATFICMKIDSF